MQFILLQDILIIFSLSVIVIYVCHRLRIPPIVGFLFTGILTGPHGFGLVRVLEAIDILAEVGVVLLLFTIGLEFSLRNLLHIRKLAFLGGFLQLSLTFGATMVFVRALGRPFAESIFLSFLFSLSSTAIVMKILQERAEVESPHGHAALGILIFQDIMVVPMMLFTPLLSGSGENLGSSLLLFLAEGIGIVLLVKFGSQKIVPWVFLQITRTRIPELFILGAILICLAVAWLTHLIGLSLALGAFLAGLIISESEYSHSIIGNVLPFRDVFTSFFFVSIGMLLDLQFPFSTSRVDPLDHLGRHTLQDLLCRRSPWGWSVCLCGQRLSSEWRSLRWGNFLLFFRKPVSKAACSPRRCIKPFWPYP